MYICIYVYITETIGRLGFEMVPREFKQKEKKKRLESGGAGRAVNRLQMVSLISPKGKVIYSFTLQGREVKKANRLKEPWNAKSL
jgi:hypothetical protein